MSYKVTPPNLKNSKSYDLCRKELGVCEITTSVVDKMRGAVSAALFPNDCRFEDFKEKSFQTTNVQCFQLSKQGLKLVKEFSQVEIKENDSEKQVLTWDELEDCTAGDLVNEYFRNFLSVFDRAYKKKVGASSE